MLKYVNRSRLGKAALAVLAFLLLTAPSARAESIVLSDNLSRETSDTETAAGERLLTASFGTGTSAANLESVTLLLANTVAGQATVSIYTDGLLSPGVLVGTLTSPASYASSLAETTFTASGISLLPDSTYWVVLAAGDAQFSWAWTEDLTGDGVGFQRTWGVSDDAGLTWYTYDIYPVQMRVTAAPVPEPGTLTLLATGATVGAGYSRRRRRRKS